MNRSRPRKAQQPTKPANVSPHWRSRITGHGKADPRTLLAHPLNWRLHPEPQQRAMRDAIERLGVIQAVIVNKTTGHLIDGHMRVQLALDNNEPAVDVIYVELNREEENLALTILNPMADLAATDPEKLARLLEAIPRETGPMDSLLAELEQQASASLVREVTKEGSRSTNVRASSPVTRVVLANHDVAIVERAIAATGLLNRGEALLQLCRSYLQVNRHEDRQFDSDAQDGLARELAESLA